MIVESATCCDYCGHQENAPIVHAPGDADVALDEAFGSEATPDFSTPRQHLSQSESFANSPAGEPASSKRHTALDDYAAEHVPASEPARNLNVVHATTSPDVNTDTLGGLSVEHGTIESQIDSDEAPVEETAQLDASTESSTPELSMPVLVAQPVKSGMGPRAMVMGVLGVTGAAFLVFAMLSTRGVASPEAASVRPQPQAPATIEPRAANREPRSRGQQTPTWNSNPATWVGNERKSAAFELAAINKVQVWMRQVQPMLVVRCRAGAAEVFVFTNSPAKMEPQDGDHTVRIRFDANPQVTERWPDSAEHDALFAPDSAAFLQQLVGSQKMEFGFSPHNSNPVVASFDVTGLAEHLAAAAKPCGWRAR